jgi:CO/xanthine dehydrogenase FAD-binding subunit
LALDAEVELVSQTGTRQLALADFIVGNRKTLRRPGEIVSQVLVPRSIENASSAFLKLGARHYLVISIVMVAVVLQEDREGRVADARVSVGSCSAVARRLPALEQLLVGAVAAPGLGELVCLEHVEDLTPISDVRGPGDYRRYAAFVLLRRALDACAGRV